MCSLGKVQDQALEMQYYCFVSLFELFIEIEPVWKTPTSNVD